MEITNTGTSASVNTASTGTGIDPDKQETFELVLADEANIPTMMQRVAEWLNEKLTGKENNEAVNDVIDKMWSNIDELPDDNRMSHSVLCTQTAAQAFTILQSIASNESWNLDYVAEVRGKFTLVSNALISGDVFATVYLDAEYNGATTVLVEYENDPTMKLTVRVVLDDETFNTLAALGRFSIGYKDSPLANPNNYAPYAEMQYAISAALAAGNVEVINE